MPLFGLLTLTLDYENVDGNPSVAMHYRYLTLGQEYHNHALISSVIIKWLPIRTKLCFSHAITGFKKVEPQR